MNLDPTYLSLELLADSDEDQPQKALALLHRAIRLEGYRPRALTVSYVPTQPKMSYNSLRVFVKNEETDTAMMIFPETWRFMRQAGLLTELPALYQQGLSTYHLLCIQKMTHDKADFQKLTPIILVSTCPKNMTPTRFAEINKSASEEGPQNYLEECLQQNEKWWQEMLKR